MLLRFANDPYLLGLRQKATVIVAAPTANFPRAEVYAATRQEAVDILRTWTRADLVFACRARGLNVPRRANRRRMAEELVAAGPAWFGLRREGTWLAPKEDNVGVIAGFAVTYDHETRRYSVEGRGIEIEVDYDRICDLSRLMHELDRDATRRAFTA